MIGRELNRYRILEKVGAGGMGEIYLALDTTLDRNVALKVVPSNFSADSSKTQRLKLEAKATSALSHPNVAHVYEIGADGDTTFIAMEYVEGVPLTQRIRERSLGVSEVLKISIQILDALEFIHAKGFIHGDLKPDNIMITATDQVKIVDFGLAKMINPAPEPSDDRTLTNAGTIRGTPLYMSPEQALGRPVDNRSDLFSFGVVLYEMLTARRPFEGATTNETIDRLLHHDPEPVSSVKPEIAAGMDRIVRKCLEKKIDARYRMAREISADVKRVGEKSVAPKTYLPRWVRDRLLYIAAALLIVATFVGLFLYWNAGSSSNHPVESLAVMPFENGSLDPEMDYLSDGITENLINSLSQLPDLRVLARSSVFRYKGKTIDPIKVGRDLKVDAVLTARVAQRGDTLDIQAELVDTQNGAQIWGNHFQRKIADIFAVQEEISLRISQALKLTLTGEQRRLMNLPRSENLDANLAYAKGLQRLNARTGQDLEKAVAFFSDSIVRDPKYAQAHAGLAYSFALLGSMEYGALAPNESIPKARDAAQRAIQLDIENRLADPHVVMGFVHLYYDWDFEAAEAEFRRAIDIDTSNTTAHHWYAEFLAATKRFDEALREIRVAQARDPLASIINTAEGRIHFLERNYNAAADRLVQTLEIDNNFVMAQVALGMVYGQQGNYAQAEKLLQQASALTGGPPVVKMSLAYNFAKAGNTAECQKIVKSLTEEKRYVSPAYLAAIYAGLGNKDQAFRYLDQAVAERSGSLVFLRVEPMVDSLRTDPRFSALLKRIGPGL